MLSMLRFMLMSYTMPHKHVCTHNAPEHFNGSFMHVVHQFYLTIQKRLEQALTLKGPVSFSQFLILMGCACKGASTLTQAKLAEHLSLTEATVSRHITTLVRKKLLTKEKEADNKKSYILELTPLGAQVFNEASAIVHEELTVCLSPISDSDKKHIISLLSSTLNFLHMKE